MEPTGAIRGDGNWRDFSCVHHTLDTCRPDTDDATKITMMMGMTMVGKSLADNNQVSIAMSLPLPHNPTATVSHYQRILLACIREAPPPFHIYVIILTLYQNARSYDN